MGQQQLLLVILVTIIVGIATVVAINTFGSAAESANQDAVRNDLAQIAASAQAYYIKPTQLGGGGRSFAGVTFQGLAFPASGLTSNNLTAANENGFYTISSPVAGSFIVTAVASSETDYVAPVIAGGEISTAGTGTATFSARVLANDILIANGSTPPAAPGGGEGGGGGI